MVRRKIEMKPIEDKSSMQVTFSKRRSGLMKKAKELSVLCQIDVGLVIFSPTGRVHQFFSGDSLKKIRRIHQITGDGEAAAEGSAQDIQKFPAKRMDPSKRVNSLDLVQSHLEDQSVEQLNVAEIAQLEYQLDAILWRTRKRKAQLMSESVLDVEPENQVAPPVTGEATADGGDGGRIDPAQQGINCK